MELFEKMDFEFATAARIIFGAGKRQEIFAEAGLFGSRVFLVTGANQERGRWLIEGLRERGMEVCVWSIPGEPQVEEVCEGVEAARAFRADVVIGLGGGSAMDGGKAISALATNEGSAFDFLEVIGLGKPLKETPLPYIAVPTTAGPGAEVTRNAVLCSAEHQVKVSLRSAAMLPRLAVADPELTYDLPPEITAATGMDALTQLIEPFVCTRANPLVDALCREGIRRVARSLRRAHESPRDPSARADLMLASLLGGLALANAGLGAVHGFAAPLGGMFRAPHGAVCAALLAPAMRVNFRAAAREGKSETERRFQEIAILIRNDPQATVEDGVHAVE